jgi:hypothetical protein
MKTTSRRQNLIAVALVGALAFTRTTVFADVAAAGA